MTVSRVATLVARTARLLRRARKMRSGTPAAPLPAGAEEFLRTLLTCERVRFVSVDYTPDAAPTRELWRLAALAAAARNLGLQVDVDPEPLLPATSGWGDRLFERLIRVSGR
jgi:hypothetical protein